jgi:hypothetical protein
MAVPRSTVREHAARMGTLSDIRRGTYEWRDGDDRLRHGESVSYRVDGVAHCDTYLRQGEASMFERFYFLLDVRNEQAEQRDVATGIVVMPIPEPDDEPIPF